MPKHLHLTRPRLDSWLTVEIHERDGRFMATADLAEDSRDIGPLRYSLVATLKLVTGEGCPTPYFRRSTLLTLSRQSHVPVSR